MKIFNTMTRQKEELKPITEGEVKIYACGPTVYNFIHIGNARPIVVFETFRRYLEYRGYKVTFVQNFTDIDDKIIKRANEEGTDYQAVALKYIDEYKKDAAGLNVAPATHHPLATENMDEIIDIVSNLVEKGYAYAAPNGDVYFRTKKFDEYGKLSHQPLDDLQSGARISIGEDKEDAMDFAVWKAAKEGEPYWDSPWSKGRPGWHIECSAMARRYLGETIDIHCGGQDLIFPHHENEIAQSEAANGCTFCNYWVHNAFVNIDGEKMSKSLGNFFTIRDIVKKYPYNVVRFFILLGHYRSPINFSDELLAAAQTSLGRISNCVRNADFVLNSGNLAGDAEADKVLNEAVQAATDSFKAHMDDDLNSADAITDIFNLVRQTNTSAQEAKVSKEALQAARDKIVELTGVLGIVLDLEDEIPEEITELANKRAEAKKAKDYAEADRIRDEIQAKGYTVKDVPGGFKIEKA